MSAAMGGNMNLVRSSKNELYQYDNDGCTALIYAVKNNQLAAVKELLDEAGFFYPSQACALEAAIEANFPEIVGVLLENEAERVAAGLTPLMEAALQGDVKTVSGIYGQFCRKTRNLQMTALMMAARRGFQGCLIHLMVEMMQVDSNGNSALTAAIKASAFNCVQELLPEVAVGQPREVGPVNTAIAVGNKGLVAQIMEHPDLNDKRSKLQIAVQAQLLGAVQKYIGQKGYIDPLSGDTALIMAAKVNFCSAVKLLTAEARVRNNDGVTAFMYARKCLKCAQVLASIESNIVDSKGISALGRRLDDRDTFTRQELRIYAQELHIQKAKTLAGFVCYFCKRDMIRWATFDLGARNSSGLLATEQLDKDYLKDKAFFRFLKREGMLIQQIDGVEYRSLIEFIWKGNRMSLLDSLVDKDVLFAKKAHIINYLAEDTDRRVAGQDVHFFRRVYEKDEQQKREFMVKAFACCVQTSLATIHAQTYFSAKLSTARLAELQLRMEQKLKTFYTTFMRLITQFYAE